jgi:hypothetical protein
MPEMWFERRHPDARCCDHDEACSVKSKSHARRLFRFAAWQKYPGRAVYFDSSEVGCQRIPFNWLELSVFRRTVSQA